MLLQSENKHYSFTDIHVTCFKYCKINLSKHLGHGHLIPGMADRPMSSKKLRWEKKLAKILQKILRAISLLLLGQ